MKIRILKIPTGTGSEAMFADGGLIDDGGKKGRKVKDVPKGYVPYPQMGANYYHNPKQSSTGTATGVTSTPGPKMSNAAWLKYVANRKQSASDDIVYTEPQSVNPIPPAINPAFMSRGENIFDTNKKAQGMSYFDLPQQSGQPVSNNAHFAYYKPNTSEIDPSQQYTIPGDVWSNKFTKGTNVLQDTTGISQYRAKFEDGGEIKEIGGKPHSEGGTPMLINGQKIEAEKGETIHTADNGDVIIGGNMVAPGTNKKFKNIFKEIGKQEQKVDKQRQKVVDISSKIKYPANSFEKLSANAAELMSKGADMKAKALDAKKEHVTMLQQAMLDTAHEHGIDAQEMSKGNIKKLSKSELAKCGMTIKKYKNGGMIAANGKSVPPGDEFDKVAYLKELASKYGVDFITIRNLVNTESGFNEKATSNAGAKGIMQFTTPTAKQYGVQNILNSSKPEDIKRVMDAGVKHFKSLIDSNHGDTTLALAAYNGGQGSVNFVKKSTGKTTISGDDLLSFYEQRRKDHPSTKGSAWQNQTYDYINTIKTGENISGFRNKSGYKVPDNFMMNFPSPIQSPSIDYIHNLPSDLPSKAQTITPIEENSYTDGVKTSPFNVPGNVNIPSDKENLDIRQLYPEIYAAATNHVEPVNLQQYTPQLKQPYQVSFQDRLNENNASFKSIEKLVDYNPEALSTLAGQKYQADSSVLADEFRQNDSQNRGIYNENINTLNDAQLKNLQLADQQYVRQSEARSNTKAIDHSILNSVASKYAQNKLENRQLQAAESMPGYRFDESGQLRWMGGDASFNNGQVGEVQTDENGKPYYKVPVTETRYKTNGYGFPTSQETRNSQKVIKKASGGSIPSLYNQIYGKHR